MHAFGILWLKGANAGSGQHQCDVCGSTFDTKKELEEHGRKMHSDQYKCEVCGESFASKGELEAHKVTMHPTQQERPRS